MAKDKNIELERKQIYLLNTITRKTARKEKRKLNKRYNHSFGFKCEMGCASCESRGYCNGDC